MKLKFLDQAEEEFVDSFRYYQEIALGLGEKYKSEVLVGLAWIQKNPEVLPLRKGFYRRLNLKIFPYGICYYVSENVIWIIAIQHFARKPYNWLSRRGKLK